VTAPTTCDPLDEQLRVYSVKQDVNEPSSATTFRTGHAGDAHRVRCINFPAHAAVHLRCRNTEGVWLDSDNNRVRSSSENSDPWSRLRLRLGLFLVEIESRL